MLSGHSIFTTLTSWLSWIYERLVDSSTSNTRLSTFSRGHHWSHTELQDPGGSEVTKRIAGVASWEGIIGGGDHPAYTNLEMHRTLKAAQVRCESSNVLSLRGGTRLSTGTIIRFRQYTATTTTDIKATKCERNELIHNRTAVWFVADTSDLGSEGNGSTDIWLRGKIAGLYCSEQAHVCFLQGRK